MSGRRQALYPEIKRLREVEHLTWRVIGERLGIALQTAHDYYTDPEGTKAAKRKTESNERLRRECPGCGASIGPAHTGIERCAACLNKSRRAARDRVVEIVAEMYRDGKSYREIAGALGYGPNSHPPQVDEARRRGLIGYRNHGWERRVKGAAQ